MQHINAEFERKRTQKKVSKLKSNSSNKNAY